LGAFLGFPSFSFRLYASPTPVGYVGDRLGTAATRSDAASLSKSERERRRLPMTARLAVCAAMLLTCGFAVANDGSRQAPTDTGAAETELKLLQIEKNIVMYTNEERERRGLAPLVIDPGLVRSARRHAIWMASNRSLQHTLQSVAENIAAGQPTSPAVVQAWMSSSGHRANILNAGHGRIGVAAYRTDDGTIYWCQQFLR
jgi:uncharacterized protein YkwD